MKKVPPLSCVPVLSKKSREDYDDSINDDGVILPVLLEAAEDVVDVSIVPLALM